MGAAVGVTAAEAGSATSVSNSAPTAPADAIRTTIPFIVLLTCVQSLNRCATGTREHAATQAIWALCSHHRLSDPKRLVSPPPRDARPLSFGSLVEDWPV